jgi:hypothetical protein
MLAGGASLSEYLIGHEIFRPEDVPSVVERIRILIRVRGMLASNAMPGDARFVESRAMR